MKEQQQHGSSVDQLLTNVYSLGKINGSFCSSHFPLYKVHKIRRAATGEPTVLSRRGLVNGKDHTNHFIEQMCKSQET